MFKQLVIVVEKDKNPNHDIAELAAKFESFQEAINHRLEKLESGHDDLRQENALATNIALNCHEDLKHQMQENQSAVENRLNGMQQDCNADRDRLNQSEANQAANQNHLTHLEHKFRESEEARKKYEQNIERQYNELRELLTTVDHNHSSTLERHDSTILEFKEILINHEKTHKQLKQESRSLTTYIEEQIRAVREEARAQSDAIKQQAENTRETTRVQSDAIKQIAEESRSAMQELVLQMRQSRKLKRLIEFKI